MAITGGIPAANLAQIARLTQPAAPASATGVNPLDLQGVTGNLLTFQSQAREFEAASQGSSLTAAGADAEAAAYGTAADISDESQRTEAIAERVRQVQMTRNIDQTVGGISASVAANGFVQSGSAIDIMQSSLQQGYLSQQISGLQSQQTQRGYMEQAAAANGEMAAAGVRGDAARLLAESQASASTSAKASQAALTQALTQLLAGDPNAQKLVDDLTSGNIAGVQADALLYNPAGEGNPLGTSASPPSLGAADLVNAAPATPATWALPNVYGNLIDGSFGLVQGTPEAKASTGLKFVA